MFLDVFVCLFVSPFVISANKMNRSLRIFYEPGV